MMVYVVMCTMREVVFPVAVCPTKHDADATRQQMQLAATRPERNIAGFTGQFVVEEAMWVDIDAQTQEIIDRTLELDVIRRGIKLGGKV